MPYIHFTEDQKLRANSVDLVEFLRRQGREAHPPPAGTNALHQITVLLFVAMSGMIMRLRKAVVLSLLFKISTA
ncbi:MAG: hypothetical protein ACLR01_01720 [Vescimonas sp.]